MSTQANDESQFLLHLATVVASRGFAVIPVGYGGCSVPGCCGPRLRHPWTYTIGLHECGHPEVVLLGLNPTTALRCITWVADEARAGNPVPIDTPLVLDDVDIKLVDVPAEWLLADPDRMGLWLNYHALGGGDPQFPAVRQLLWADAQGRFPDGPMCSPAFAAAQPILSVDPLRYPKIRPRTITSRHRRTRHR